MNAIASRGELCTSKSRERGALIPNVKLRADFRDRGQKSGSGRSSLPTNGLVAINSRIVGNPCLILLDCGRPANAWCKCLSEHYQTLMSRDEESLYGNDFERLFFRGIAQPNSTDPGWQRFHPACGQCAR